MTYTAMQAGVDDIEHQAVKVVHPRQGLRWRSGRWRGAGRRQERSAGGRTARPQGALIQ